MYINVVTEMSPDRNGQIKTAQTETARPKSPVPAEAGCQAYKRIFLLLVCIA